MSRIGERLEPLETLDGIRAEWTQLAERGRSVFATWEWHATWWRHFGQRRQLALTACHDRDGRLAALLPLCVRHCWPLRIARFVGHGLADEAGPVCAGGDRALAREATLELLGGGSLRWDVFVGDSLPEAEGWSPEFGGEVFWRESSPVLRFAEATWEEFLAARSSNFRQQLRRKERRLLEDHGATFRVAQEPDRFEEDLDALFRLHAARWVGVHSDFAAKEAFHRDFARAAFEQGWLRLMFLDIAGQPVAAYMGFRFAGVESYYQAGRLRDWDGASVGLVLLAHSVRSALEDGFKEYRFLGGDQEYKFRFANRDQTFESFLVGGSLTGRAVLAARTASRRFRPLRRTLRRFRHLPFGGR